MYGIAYRSLFEYRTLFQFDSADLDFGIYRIMNYKREVIERFIENDLIKAVSQELKNGELGKQSDARERNRISDYLIIIRRYRRSER